MTRPDTACVLCGDDTSGVRVSLVCWKNARTDPYTALPRCTDRRACRDRVEHSGDRWLVEDPSDAQGRTA